MKTCSVLFIACCVLSSSITTKCHHTFTNSVLDVIVINKILDQFLKYVRIAIRDEHVDRIVVPDLNVVFQAPLSIQGTFNATDGSVAYLSTVYRTGDAKLIYGKDFTTVTLDLGLEQLVVDYNNYKAKVLDIGPTGIMRATIGKNSILASLSFYYNLYNCSQELDSLVMDEFDDISVRLTGLDPFNWLLDDIAIWIAKDFKDNIKYLVEDNIRKAAKSVLTKYNICKYLPHVPKQNRSKNNEILMYRLIN